MSSIVCREITDKDKREAWIWFNYRLGKKSGRKNCFFPYQLLPNTGLGAVDYNNRLLAVAFLYLEKSSTVAVCGWCIANPANSPHISKQAVELVLSQMPEYAKSYGATHLLSTFGSRSINRILRKNGFMMGEKADNMYVKLEY